MSSILEEIETKIAGLKTSASKSNVGVVRETGDGVARIEGLSDVMLNEMIEFPNGVFGLALNLEETEVGAILPPSSSPSAKLARNISRESWRISLLILITQPDGRLPPANAFGPPLSALCQ